jgi:hypothetical protein
MTGKAKIIIDDGPTPSETIVRAAKKVVEVTDALGRTLKVRKLNALNKVDLAKMVGADGSVNEAVIGPCAVAFSVCEIDGEAILPPANYNELRLLVLRLDDEGLEAASQAHVDHFGIQAASENPALAQALAAADLKNS